MIFEMQKVAFAAIPQPIAGVTGGLTLNGRVIDFDAPNQFIENHYVLEAFVVAKATAGQTVVEGEGEEPDVVTPHAPTLSVLVETSATGTDEWATVSTGKTFALASLTEGVVVHKVELSEECKQFIRISLVNSSEDDFTGGSVFGLVRPL